MRKRKFIAIALAFITALSCMSVTAFAEGNTTTIQYQSPIYNTAGDSSTGISCWETVSKEDVTVATSGADLSSGGWFAITSWGNNFGEINVSNDLNLYIASGASFACTGLNAAGKNVTIYGDGYFACDGTITASLLEVNGTNIDIEGADGTNGTSESPNGGDGSPAINGNLLLNAGSGTIDGGAGGSGYGYDDLENLELYQGHNGGDGGDCVTGSIHVNGSTISFYRGNSGCCTLMGEEGDRGHISKSKNITLATNVSLEQYDTYYNASTIGNINNQYYAVVYTVSALNSISSFNGQGGVSFTVNTSSVTEATSKDTVTATATQLEGYEVVLSSSDVTFTTNANGVATFTMPGRIVTVTATYTPYKYLDLESSGTYLDTHSVSQTYTLTQTGDTTYTDVTKVKLEWIISDITATYASNKTWNPDTLSWTETKIVADIADKTAEFTLTNYSSEKVVGTVSFAAETALEDTLTSATFDSNNGKTIDTIVNSDHTIDETKKTNVPSNTITATLVFDEDEFAELDATTQATKYGAYTVTISAVPTVSANYLTFTATGASSVTPNFATGTAQYSEDGGTTWKDATNGTAIQIADGKSICMRNKGDTACTTDAEHSFSMTGSIAASGDVTSLTNGVGGDVNLAEAYNYLDEYSGCYQCMFCNCTSLTSAPSLPSTTLSPYCYNAMFGECTALTSATKLPATTLAKACYMQMFRGCSSLNISTTGNENNKIFTCTATNENWEVDSMFYQTNFTDNYGTPANGTTYYW